MKTQQRVLRTVAVALGHTANIQNVKLPENTRKECFFALAETEKTCLSTARKQAGSFHLVVAGHGSWMPGAPPANIHVKLPQPDLEKFRCSCKTANIHVNCKFSYKLQLFISCKTTNM